MEAHLTVPIKQERTSLCRIEDNVHPNCKRRGWRAVMVEMNGYPDLLVGAV